MIMKKMILFNVTPINTDVTDLQEFEAKVAAAKKAGATHILITEVEKSRWIWEKDLSDPYPNWGMLNSALFKIIVPDELKRWLPTDYAARNLELVKGRAKICKKYGLKCAAHFCEPFYLPEEVFRAHPEWRGPRCDHPRRARNYYYSPCMDHPQVLEMYRKAMKKLCELCEIDYVYLHTNDCGAGICWSSGLYAGPNGPEACKHIPMSERILNYFRVFRQGARDAGREIMIETNSNIGVKENEHVMDSIWPLLEDGMAVNFKNNQNQPLSSLVDVNYEFTFAPVRNIPLLMTFIELLEKGWHEPSQVLKIGIMDDDFHEYFRIVEKFFAKPTHGLLDRIALLRELAAEIAGEQSADGLVEAWNQIEIGLKHFQDTYTEGLSWCSVNQRLINRPFVLFPEELLPSEKEYYRPFQFQAVDEKQANDLLNNQCTTFIRGYYAIFAASRNCQRAIDCFNKASRHYLNAAAQNSGETAEKLALAADRLKLLSCFFHNYIHAMKIQHIIDTTDYSVEPEISPRWPIDADPRLLEFEKLNRAEIDNTYTIINLIEGREREMLVLAPTHEQEDIFWLSPKITGQLKHKAEIMLNHQLDGKRLFVTNNK